MRAFITGGTGFIGSAVIRLLNQAGFKLRALVRPKADTRSLDGLDVERIQGDLNNLESLRNGISGCDWVFHVAALYSFWGYRWEDFYQANVEGIGAIELVFMRGGIH